jgi:hypothetical protein
MTTPAQDFAPLVSDAQGDAKTAVAAIAAAADAILNPGTASTELTALDNDALAGVEAFAENLVPASVRGLVVAIVSTANAAAHSAISSTLLPAELAAVALAKANCDAALAHL